MIEIANPLRKTQKPESEETTSQPVLVGAVTNLKTINIGNVDSPVTCTLVDLYCPKCGRKMVYTATESSLYAGCCNEMTEIFHIRPYSTKGLSEVINSARNQLRDRFRDNMAKDIVPSTVRRVRFHTTDGTTTNMLLHKSRAGRLLPDENGFIVGRIDSTTSSPLPLEEYNSLSECSISKDKVIRAVSNGTLDILESVYDGTVQYNADGTYTISTDNR